MVAIREQFSSFGPGREREWARQRRWFIKAKHDHQRREDMAGKQDDSAAVAGFAASVMASPEQIKAFETKLDTYDEATIRALEEIQTRLEENARELEAARLEQEHLLNQAFILDDGRRVFKSEDGSFVIDEFGADVAEDEIDFDIIEGPSAETYSAVLGNVTALEAEREQLTVERDAIHDFRSKLDDAREQIAGGDITESDLEQLDAELADLMPDSVRTYAGLEPREAELSSAQDRLTETEPARTVAAVSQGAQFTPMQ